MSWDWSPETLSALAGFLRARGLYTGDPAPRRIGDGHSNLTYLINAGPGQVVLRRPPPPPIPKGANDVMREARVMAALAASHLPLPTVLATAAAGQVLDVPFYIMDHVLGHVITDTLPKGFDAKRDGQAMAMDFADTLAHLHAVDWQAVGLEGFGNPDGFNARHLARMEGLMHTRKGAVPEALQAMADWLRARVPAESGASIVHNDYRLGNLIWRPGTPPKLAAILDWELATIGDPMLDLGYMAVCYPEADQPLNPTQELSAAFLSPGFPPAQAIFDRYAETSGRDLAGLGWFTAFQAWKLAVLYGYMHHKGTDAYYRDTTQVPRFIAHAKRIAARL